MNARLEEIGLTFDIESMARAITQSRHEDLQLFWANGVWTARWWYDEAVQDRDESQWGAVIQANTLKELLEETTYAMFFS